MMSNKLMKQKTMTINADIGEGCDDSLVIPFLDWANVCCGQHAGSEELSKQTIQLVEQQNVGVGAHPGYPDRENFGRISQDLTEQALYDTLYQQIGLINAHSQKMLYVKPHGALNHDMLQSDTVFEVICKVVADIGCKHIMVPTNERQQVQIALAEKYHLTLLWEVFADRAYESNGLLRPRKYADAVHQDAETIVAQIKRIREKGEIVAVDGSVIDISYADSICIHGDNQASVSAVGMLKNTAG